jgi:lactose/L-arabinose transport system permease protein
MSATKIAPYAFIAPFFILFGVFGLLPLISSLVMSLIKWSGLIPGGFTGLANYVDLFGDPSFHRALVNTAILWLQVPLTLSVALALAVLLDSRIVRMKSLFRMTYFLPVILSLVVGGLAFNLLLDPRFGLANTMLRAVGLPEVNWIGDEFWTKPSLIMLTVWRWSGYYMAIMLGGLQSIDQELYDAARVDGASAWRSFRHVTLPLMRPIIAFAAVLATVGSLGNFEQIYVMFGRDGGVGESGLSTGLLIWREAFLFNDFGVASALAYVVAAVILFMVAWQLWVFRDLR